MGTSSLLLVGGWGGSAITAVLYGKDWLCNAKHFLVVHKDGEEQGRKHFDGTDVHKRDGKGEGSDEESSDEEEIIITRGKKKKGSKKGKESDEDDDDDDD